MKNDTDKEEKQENTLIEDLFQAKRNRGMNWGSFNSEDKDKEKVEKNDENLNINENKKNQEIKLVILWNQIIILKIF